MKNYHRLFLLIASAAIGALLTGCLLRPANVTTRQFVLTPAASAGQPRTAEAFAIGLGAVKMPEYLLRSSLAVRKSELEVEYLDNAAWAERLDQSFQRVLAANLAQQLPGSRIQRSTWLNSQVTLAVFVSAERFDVDAQGKGTLLANWRIETPDGRQVLKDGVTSLNQAGASPNQRPEIIAATLSELTAQFSEALARAIRECASKAPAH